MQRFAAGAVLAAAAGTFGSLDTALNIAFPDLVADFDLTVGQLQWVVILFVAASGGLLLPAGVLGDRIGHTTAVVGGAAISVVAMLGCAVAPTFGSFLAARVVQGVGTATVMASAPALATLASTPERRAHAVGVFQSAAAFGLATGPIIGGLMVLLLGWRGVFWFRVPIAVLLMLLALVSRSSPRRRPMAVAATDIPAAATVAGARGWARIVRLALGRQVVIANLLTFVANGAMFATWLLVPSLLVDERGVSVIVGGLVLAVSPVMTAFGASRAGRVVDRIGPWTTGVGGLLVMTVGLAAIAATGWGWPTSTVVVALALIGLGLGFFSVPNMASVMGALPESDQGVAGALNLMMRTLGIVAGAAWHALVFDRVEVGATFEAAFGVVFAVAAGIMAAAAAVAVLNPPRRLPSAV